MVPVKKSTREQNRDRHEAKLDHIREQVATGNLVIRKMTRAEKAAWAAQTRRVDASSTPDERARRAQALEKRRKRDARLS